MKICSTKHFEVWRIISPSREPFNSHQVGLQNKFRFHVHRLRSGLFYENSTELDEVDSNPYPTWELTLTLTPYQGINPYPETTWELTLTINTSGN